MPWEIIEQEEKRGKNSYLVRCKKLRFYPIERPTGTEFGRLNFLLFQVIVQNAQGYRLRLKLNASQGLTHPKWVIQHPDKEDYQMKTVGQGRNKRIIPDLLSPKIKYQGEKETFTLQEFEARTTKMLGGTMAQEVITLLASRLPDQKPEVAQAA